MKVIGNKHTKQIFLLIALSLSLINCDIIVRSPSSVRKEYEKLKITTSYATFGFNPYGYTVTGRVYYDPDNQDKELACDYEKLKNIITDKTNIVDSAPIIMVDRGSCHFADKARNIQMAGGKVALIINNDNTDPKNIIMSDDGTGSDITIPLVLISKADGQILKDYYAKNKHNPEALKKLVLDVDFQIEHFSNTALVEFFLNSESEEIYKVIKDITGYSELSKIININSVIILYCIIHFCLA